MTADSVGEPGARAGSNVFESRASSTGSNVFDTAYADQFSKFSSKSSDTQSERTTKVASSTSENSLLEPAYGMTNLQQKLKEWSDATSASGGPVKVAQSKDYQLDQKGIEDLFKFPGLNQSEKGNQKPQDKDYQLDQKGIEELFKFPGLKTEGDSRIENGGAPKSPDTPAKLYELNNMAYRGRDERNGPDAMVLIPKGFDQDKPINLVIYNHGWGSTAQSAYRTNDLAKQMSAAPPNTVLIVPEWQASPGQSNSRSGATALPGRFDMMLQQAFRDTPELRGKSLSDVGRIDLFCHSAGYTPGGNQMFNNALAGKVKGVHMLDGNYENTFDPWIKANIDKLSRGEMQFTNFYNDTASLSKGGAARVQQLLKNAGLPQSTMMHDTNPGTVLNAAEIGRQPIVFKSSDVSLPKMGAHSSMPGLYIRPVLQALKSRGQ